MRLLLDTHVALWWLAEPERLPDDLLGAIRDLETEVFVSSASVWEMAIKSSIGKLELDTSLATLVADITTNQAIEEMAINHTHALIVAELPLHHRDPFDRVLIAQSIAESLTLVTADRAVALYEVDIWEI